MGVGGIPEQNKNRMRQFFDTVVNQRNPSRLGEFVAEDGTCGGKTLEEMVSNPDPMLRETIGNRLVPPSGGAAGGGGAPPPVSGAEPDQGGNDEPPPVAGGEPDQERADVAAFRDFTAHVLEAFPDMKVDIESMIAEGDEVVVRWKATGTHRGEFLGTPPTGRKVPMSNVDIFTLKDGKIVKVLAHPDAAGVLHALGHLPSTPIVQALAAKAPQ